MNVLLRVAPILVTAMVLAGCNSQLSPTLMAGSDASPRNLAKVDGNVPRSNAALRHAKEQFHERNYGLAEKKFRAIIEADEKNAEAWLGLAASYDQLQRFKLADRAYKEVRALNGPSAALHNNLGYSHLLRGNRRRARREFLKARAIEPKNQFVRNNLRALLRTTR